MSQALELQKNFLFVYLCNHILEGNLKEKNFLKIQVETFFLALNAICNQKFHTTHNFIILETPFFVNEIKNFVQTKQKQNLNVQKRE